jgi:hypothetical protein
MDYFDAVYICDLFLDCPFWRGIYLKCDRFSFKFIGQLDIGHLISQSASQFIPSVR